MTLSPFRDFEFLFGLRPAIILSKTFPSHTVSDDPDGRTCETWKAPPVRGRPSASHQMRRTISRGELRVKASKTFFFFNGKAVRKNFSSGKP